MKQTFGEWIRERRVALSLSQSEAAGLANIDRPTWSDYERGAHPERTPREITLYGIAKALQLDYKEVFKRAGIKVPPIGPLLVPTNVEGEASLQQADSAFGDIAMAVVRLQREVAELRRQQDKPEDGR